MRISYWSSDVCSSDLSGAPAGNGSASGSDSERSRARGSDIGDPVGKLDFGSVNEEGAQLVPEAAAKDEEAGDEDDVPDPIDREIGRATGRARVGRDG